MKRTEWEAMSVDERRSHANPDRPCIERGCTEPAGTPWGPLWCADHDDARINRISANLEAIVAEVSAVTAVHDTLRQAITDRVIVNHLCEMNQCPRCARVTDEILAAVLADPTVARWKNIADAVDNEPKYARPLTDPKSFDAGHDMLLAKFRAAGETT